MQDEHRNLIKRFIELGARRRAYIQSILCDTEIYFGQLPIMEYISKNEGCTQQEMSENLRVSPASVALSVKRLCRTGLLIKVEDEHNKRCNRIYTTEKCGAEICKAKLCLDSADKIQFAGFSDEEMIMLEKLLDKMIENFVQEK